MPSIATVVYLITIKNEKSASVVSYPDRAAAEAALSQLANSDVGYVIETEHDVERQLNGKLLVDVFNGLTEAGVKKFENKAIGAKRLMSVLPQVAIQPKTAQPVKGKKMPKTPTPLTKDQLATLVATAPQPAEDTKCGAYIRQLVMVPAEDDASVCRFTTPEIVALARYHFKDSTAATSDVSWNRGKLKKDGIEPLAVRREVKAGAETEEQEAA